MIKLEVIQQELTGKNLKNHLLFYIFLFMKVCGLSIQISIWAQTMLP